MKKIAFAIMFGTICLAGLPSWAVSRIHVMILDGESAAPYHRWQVITPVLKKELDETGLFDVDVVTAPPAGSDFSNFNPDWNKYQVIVFNYDAPDNRWSADIKASFEKYIKNGGGLVTVHAADNAFPGWRAFNQMIGVGGWRGRNEKSGPHWFYKNNKLVSDDSPDRAGSHGLRVPFKVTVRDAEHPITKGLPKVWMHQGDELYANLRGPGRNMTVLATAYSDPTNRGTGVDEPQLMVVRYGKGRIFHSTFGHDVAALSSVDAIVTFQRGVEWAATGKVTQKVPISFPTADTVSYRTDIAAMDPNYAKGLNPMDMQAGHGRARAGPRNVLLTMPLLTSDPLASAQRPDTDTGRQAPGAAAQTVVPAHESYPPALVQSGGALFLQNCAFCHGRDAEGGETGPDLTRSKLVAQDVAGSTIDTVVRNGRPEKGMPHFDFSDQELAGLVAFIHSQKEKAQSNNGRRRGVDISDLQTGNVEAGKQYFNGAGNCASCHSATGDLAGIASRYQGLELEERMLYPKNLKSKVTVTLPSGEKLVGTLAYLDEFTVGMVDASGTYRSWTLPRVKYSVDSPVDAHVRQFPKYTDNDIHNLMAYLQTLR